MPGGFVGHLPFEGRDKTEVKRSIKAGRLRPLPLTLSSPAIDFIVSMLEYDAARRPSAAELLQHPFIKMHSGCSSLPPIPRHILRDDSANDTETAVLSDKKLVALQVRPAASLPKHASSHMPHLPQISVHNSVQGCPCASSGKVSACIQARGCPSMHARLPELER